jgi:4-amino-4-deoxy-L-arabinose transferase-like glycosyltransferase
VGIAWRRTEAEWRAFQRSTLIALALFGIALAFRLPDLGAACHIDGTNHWFGRTQKFWTALSDGRFADTHYSPHPGVTLMWLSGASMKLLGVLGMGDERAIVAATLPGAVLGALVSPFTYLLSRRVLAIPRDSARFDHVPILSAFLLATEPFMVGNARTYHMDSLMSGFMWTSALLVVLTLIELRSTWALLAGLSLGLSILTRMATALFALSVAIPFAVSFLRERPRSKRLPRLLALMAATTMLVCWLGWPALLFQPLSTLASVLEQSSGLVDRGHRMFAWGRVHPTDPGFTFYVGTLLVRLSPEVLAGAITLFFVEYVLPRRAWRVLAVLGVTYLPYTLAVWWGSKKSDRYLLFLFPVLVFYAAVVLEELVFRVRNSRPLAKHSAAVLALTAGLLVSVRLGRLARVHPLPITWCAAYPGVRCEDVITIGGGEGFRDVARWISRHARTQNPKVLSAYSGGEAMRPWLDFRAPASGSEAEFVVTYIASDQRELDRGILAFAAGPPLHEVRYDGRVYSRIYRGPAYAKAAK